jgi:hypothetical protein
MFSLIVAFLPLMSVLDDEPVHVMATVRSSMESDAAHIRQFAFDGDESTSFFSTNEAKGDDQFTLIFDKPVALRSVRILGGTDESATALDGGLIEVSEDGKTFIEFAPMTGADTTADGKGRMAVALRIKPSAEPNKPVEIREINVESIPPVAKFTAPIEFVVDVADAPEMADWSETVVKACERAYPMICDELKSDGYQPARLIHLRLKKDYKGVAEASGTRITGSVDFFKAHPDDIGAFVHETAHVVQRYRGRGNPGWLVEGVADYIRFFKYEPENIGPINANRTRYNSSYRVSASFLDYLNRTYDKSLVHDLNAAMREGRYDEAIFKDRTGKTLP